VVDVADGVAVLVVVVVDSVHRFSCRDTAD